DYVRLISQDLKEAGYNCGYSGKWHCGTSKVPSTYGFRGMDVPAYGHPFRTKEYKEYIKKKNLKEPSLVECIPPSALEKPRLTGKCGTYSGDPEACEPYFIADYSINMIKDFLKEGKPFMMFVSFWGPHHPCVVPEPYASMYSPEDVQLWDSFDDDLKCKPRAHRIFRNSIYPGGKDLSRETWKKMIAKYWGACTFIDDQVGRMMKALDELGISDTTAILFSTDHGDTMGCHGQLWDKGPFMYEDTYHIPQIVKIPWLRKEGDYCEKFVFNMDLATTALDIAGIKPKSPHDARSLLPLVENPNAEWPDDIMSEFHGHRFIYTMRMIRWDKYKYVFNAADFDELYDLEKDPSEMNNLIANREYAKIADEGRKRLLKWIKDTSDVFDICAADYVNERSATVDIGLASNL
ncbi:MAG TPA: sulfatase-like hydrolase/transferase, partial [Victivallales bacterium]|nr:sulfatase-like hydrolase/transferase [Victivallales bacterium]